MNDNTKLKDVSNPTIYILGLGSIGSFVAHSLRSLPNPPSVTLLLHREELHQQFTSKDSRISLQIREDGSPTYSSGFNVELLHNPPNSTSNPAIRCLILAVKASATVAALKPIKHRLGKHSTICLFQNGCGQDEELNVQLFPDPLERPTYVFGIMQHGVFLKAPFEAILAGTIGTASVGVVGAEYKADDQETCRFILSNLTRSPALCCTELPWPELQRVQLLKLAANCLINPLTALLDVRNGILLENPAVEPLRRRLLEEVCLVLQSLPAFQAPSRDECGFSFSGIENAVVNTIKKTAANSSSMREDIRKGRATEIQFINGWIVSQGKKLGIECPSNALLTELILAKSYQKDQAL